MTSQWTERNEITKTGRKVVEVTGTSSSINNASAAAHFLASRTNSGYNIIRDGSVKRILDPAFGKGVQTMINFLVGSGFKPNFNRDDFQGSDHYGGAYILDPSSVDRERRRIPPRMWDIDSGNLVEELDADKVGYYSILSHSWKGREIDYAFVSKVKQASEKKLKYDDIYNNQPKVDIKGSAIPPPEVRKYAYLDDVTEQNDVQKIKAQCNENLRLQRLKIDAAVRKSGQGSINVRDLLDKRAKVKDAEWVHSKVKREVKQKKRELLAKQMVDGTLKWRRAEMGVSVETTTEAKDEEGKATDPQEDGNTQSKEKELEEASDKLRRGEETLSEAEAGCKSIDKSLCDAVDELFPLLQQRFSAHKIEKSIAETRRILDTGIFPTTQGRRYLWNDTCCINKAIVGEHIESLALMGEWYTNAEFCLVHLDTAPSSVEWVTVWDYLESEDRLYEMSANFKEFKDVKKETKPHWATRGWTLQELALSKMAFFVNNVWTPLNRPVENLGPYYYLWSYLKQYTDGSSLFSISKAAKVLDDIKELRKVMDEGEKITFVNVKDGFEKKHRLIGILNFLEVEFPKNIDDLTANAHIYHSIEDAAKKIARICKGENSARTSRIKTLLGSFEISEEQVETLIKLLIKDLVKAEDPVDKDPIHEDRKRIHDFSEVPALECCRGASKTKLTAVDILALASKRNVTVATDQVYSLMGMLGVKFAAFHAEGLTKALSRLLDEVITTSKDVSVFHWTGRELGSPVMGRSLYPVNFDAFKSPGNNNDDVKADRLVANALQDQRKDLLEVSENLSTVLQKLLSLINSSTEANQPINELLLMLNKISESDIKDIKPQLLDLRKTVTYLEDQEKYDAKKDDAKDEDSKGNSKMEDDDDKKTSLFGMKGPSLPLSMHFGKPGRTKPSDKRVEQPTEKEPPKGDTAEFKLKKFGMKESKHSNSPIETSTTPQVSTKSLDLKNIQTRFKNKYDTVLGNITGTLEPSNDLEDFKKWSEKIKPIPPCNLAGPGIPERNKNSQDESLNKKDLPDASKNSTMISPNPIIVDTSGIGGVFDIQRIIVTMQNPDKLRKEIGKLTSVNHKIGGECTISTGFASVAVAFCCEKHVLQKQLDACDVIENTILERGVGSRTSASPTDANMKVVTDQNPQSSERATDTKPEENESGMKAKTHAQKRMQRMLKFVQESDLNLIAGEWVLARFSGVRDAKWFLCRLELGSTHEYYGWRIATDEFDFSTSAVPEKELVGWWETYMNQKKVELCRIVRLAIQSRKLKAAETKISENHKPGSPESQNQEEDEEEEISTWAAICKYGFDNVTLVGTWLLRNITDKYTVQLNQALDETVLRPVPKHLRTAIMNLHEDRNWLPAMFIPAAKVHML
ncbi:MAG: hypothetical protein M1834_005787 [Cirrosporium novae-zelandiae]|nr:MAG: hypothetical protein M1834_005787 [Cirrosporium novae-zelandiae]